MVASGAYAKRHGLSISHEDESIRIQSVKALSQMIDFAGAIDAGVVCGFIKGDGNGNPDICRSQIKKSLKELNAGGYFHKAPVYIEATNHYEALLANTLEDAASFISMPPFKSTRDCTTMSIYLITTGIILALEP